MLGPLMSAMPRSPAPPPFHTPKCCHACALLHPSELAAGAAWLLPPAFPSLWLPLILLLLPFAPCFPVVVPPGLEIGARVACHLHLVPLLLLLFQNLRLASSGSSLGGSRFFPAAASCARASTVEAAIHVQHQKPSGEAIATRRAQQKAEKISQAKT